MRLGTFKYDWCMSDNKNVISDEAVEAALVLSLRQLGLWGRNLPDDLVRARRDSVRELLEAAAPYMLAEAWDEGAESVEWCEIAIPCGDCDQCRKPAPTNPYRSQA